MFPTKQLTSNRFFSSIGPREKKERERVARESVWGHGFREEKTRLPLDDLAWLSKFPKAKGIWGDGACGSVFLLLNDKWNHEKNPKAFQPHKCVFGKLWGDSTN